MDDLKHLSWEEAVLWLRDQPEHSSLVKACFYDDPLINAAKRYYQSDEWQAVRILLADKVPGSRVLDIGAGRGISSYALATDGWDVVSLEPDVSDVVGCGAIRNLARETGLPINVVEAYGEHLPFEDESFDVVHCRQVLHHANDLNQLCKEIGRILKSGGLLIATREHVISKKSDLEVFLNDHHLHKLYGGENAYLIKEYKSAIRSAGIQLVQVLNPLESNINLYPETTLSTKLRIAKKAHFPFPFLMPDWMLGLLGKKLSYPGRLYSFIGRKI